MVDSCKIIDFGILFRGNGRSVRAGSAIFAMKNEINTILSEIIKNLIHCVFFSFPSEIINNNNKVFRNVALHKFNNLRS